MGGGDAEEGEDTEPPLLLLLSKHLGAIRERREKRWTQLNLRGSHSRLLYIQLTPRPKKHRRTQQCPSPPAPPRQNGTVHTAAKG